MCGYFPSWRRILLAIGPCRSTSCLSITSLTPSSLDQLRTSYASVRLMRFASCGLFLVLSSVKSNGVHHACHVGNANYA